MCIAHSRVQVWVELPRNSLHAESIHMHIQLKRKLKLKTAACGTLSKICRHASSRSILSRPLPATRCQPRAAGDPVMSGAITRVKGACFAPKSARSALSHASDRARQSQAYTGAE